MIRSMIMSSSSARRRRWNINWQSKWVQMRVDVDLRSFLGPVRRVAYHRTAFPCTVYEYEVPCSQFPVIPYPVPCPNSSRENSYFVLGQELRVCTLQQCGCRATAWCRRACRYIHKYVVPTSCTPTAVMSWIFNDRIPLVEIFCVVNVHSAVLSSRIVPQCGHAFQHIRSVSKARPISRACTIIVIVVYGATTIWRYKRHLLEIRWLP